MSKEHDKRSIESQGRRWAKKRAESMVEGPGRTVLLIRDTEKYRQIEELPEFLDQRRSPYLKYDDVGNIYVSKWRTMKTELDEENKRRLINPRELDYRVLNPKTPRSDYVNNLPLRVPVAEVIWAKIEDGIETAMRKQKHILESFDPSLKDSEIGVAQRVVEHVDNLATTFIAEKVTNEDLEELAEKTETFLEENDLISSEDRDKKHIRDMLLAVPKTDSLGRVNPLVSRVRARAAYLAATRRLVMGSLVAQKFGGNLEVLSYERELTRWALRTALKQIDFYVYAHSYIQSGIAGTELQKSSLRDAIETITNGHLATPRVKPYIKIARYAQLALNGPDMGNGQLVRDVKIFGEDIAKQIYRQVPVAMLIDMNNHESAKERVRQIKKGIYNTLIDHEDTKKES